FTPTVLAEGQIRLNVAPTISEPDYSAAVQVEGYYVPGLTERRVETVVEVGSGQTIAIGGLLSESLRATSQKIPGLGDLPVLGQLFSSLQYQREETELVILVTPELVSGISPQQVTHVPGATMVPPNDFEFYLMGQLEGTGEPGEARLEPHVNRVLPARTNETYDAAAVMRLRGPVGPAGSEEGL
ncbi:MAG: secretion system protein, partial [Phycisphaerae bacterium]|nr:secretion system protein [Phycisphaerae bacterium]